MSRHKRDPELFCVLIFMLASGCGDRSDSPPPQAELKSQPVEEVSRSDQAGARIPSAGDDLGALPHLEGKKFDAAIRDVVAREDPIVDGWSSEHFAELAGKQLKTIGRYLTGHIELSESPLQEFCSNQYRSTELRPKKLSEVFNGSSTIVRRGGSEQFSHEGVDGFRNALRRLAEPFSMAEDARFKFKVIRVERRGKKATTRNLFEISGRIRDMTMQISSTWDCEWIVDEDGKQPRLSSIRVFDYEEVNCEIANGLQLFSDCTESAFDGLPVLQEQLVHGRDHWYGNLEATIGVEGRGNGIAIADVNGDGLDDIYFCQPAALPNRLFVRQPDGSMRDVSTESGVDWLDSSRAAMFVDLDNDGDSDLVLTHSTTVVVQENDGTGKFDTRRTIDTISRLFSINAVDFDGDGLLDLFVCGYSSAANARPEDVFVSPVPYHDANNGGPNYLLRNEGDWTFTDVTERVGLNENNLRFSLASTWDDFDNDGDLDLYVANDFGRNNLYRNGGGRFVDIAKTVGVEDIGPGMSATWNDYNNDGFVDLYVSNMFSSAGSRITHNAQFKPGVADVDRAGFQRHARGNSLFENDQRGGFSDQSIPAAVTMGRWAWGSLFADLNNDGWRDIYVANGFVTADNNNDL